ncbi:unnamed protein product [Chondrus crispus]|uniref:Phosphate transporter n=1 Tax=Chondrus crispus TaxID=2769 RepID=R7Q988_CHOCR|nr:unnamed protein product [Chondrus crispus]CDF34368.1 unnamed protein product [Chondrus crispus]|eukprot:XP_005714187.1 unnamed protein product [Chondrus crispus]
MAWGIGANDVANAFATSVGAGSLSLKWACVIAAVMEFLGAFLMGGSVTDTVRKKIIDTDVFDPVSDEGAANGPELLMTGFLVALLASTTWLIIATYLSLPVSTTHSVIGSLIGVGLAFRGGSAVVWISEGSGFSKLKGVVGVVLSWVISPVLSAVFAIIMFLLVRTLVLRRPEPFKAGLMFMPLFYGFTIAVTIFFIIYKGDKRFSLSKKLSVGVAIGIAIGGGAVIAILSWFLIVPLAKKNVDEDVVRMHGNVEVFDLKTERLFSWIQVFTAAFDAFAHGANDVANAIAPFSSIYQLYRNNGQISKQPVPLWILALGGVGIVAGLAMWGYRIIIAIGVKLTKLTPARGFSIEIGAAITVIIASRIGLPVSTTHCQVGATMGVGLIEFKKSTVNWKQFLFICIGWVFTVIFTGFLSAGLFATLTYSPSNFRVPQGDLNYCPGNRLFQFNEESNEFQGIGCSGF